MFFRMKEHMLFQSEEHASVVQDSVCSTSSLLMCLGMVPDRRAQGLVLGIKI